VGEYSLGGPGGSIACSRFLRPSRPGATVRTHVRRSPTSPQPTRELSSNGSDQAPAGDLRLHR